MKRHAHITPIAWFLILIASSGLWRCSHNTVVYPQHSVILISIDTLRSDHLPCYGYGGVPTPHLSGFAEDAVLFERAYAHAPLTLPSHATLLTGLLPPTHGARDNVGFVLPEEVPTLPEALGERGYVTSAVVSSMVLRSNTGMAQGFDHFDDHMPMVVGDTIQTYPERRGGDSVKAATQWLEQLKESPFFLMLHLYDPHTPYAPPVEFRGSAELAYDTEIAYVDHVLGQFFQFLKAKDLYDDTVIVVLSDHGEGLGDHGEWEHGMLLYRESLQVPLLVKLPGQARAGERRTDPVGLVDVAPTLASLLDVPFESQGRPLFDSGSEPHSLYSETLSPALHYGWIEQQSSICGPRHFIISHQEHLFDLLADPKETRNLINEQDVPLPCLRMIEEQPDHRSQGDAISAGEREMLESLGYLGSTVETGSAAHLSEPQFLELFYKLAECKQFLEQGQYAQSEPVLMGLLKLYPSMVDIRKMLGSALTGQGKYALAEPLLEETLMMAPANLSVMASLATTKLELGKHAEARSLVDALMRREPVLGANLLLPHLLAHHQWQVAGRVAETALQHDSSQPHAHLVMGRLAYEDEDFRQALAHFDATQAALGSVEESPLLCSALFYRADCHARMGQNGEALELFDELLTRCPDHAQGHASRALLLFSTQQGQKAMADLQTWLERDPSPTNIQKAAEVLEIVGLKRQARQLLKDAGL